MPFLASRQRHFGLFLAIIPRCFLLTKTRTDRQAWPLLASGIWPNRRWPMSTWHKFVCLFSLAPSKSNFGICLALGLCPAVPLPQMSPAASLPSCPRTNSIVPPNNQLAQPPGTAGNGRPPEMLAKRAHGRHGRAENLLAFPTKPAARHFCEGGKRWGGGTQFQFSTKFTGPLN